MDAKVMKETIGKTAQMSIIEVGNLSVNQEETFTFDFPASLFVISGSLYSTSGNFVSMTLMKTGYFYTQNANRMFVIVESQNQIVLKALTNWYGVQIVALG